MELIKFDPKVHLRNDGMRVWLINFSEYYLGELCDKWEILNRISGGWDDVPYRRGKKEFRGCCINVTDYEYLQDMEKNHILLILDSYPKARFDLLMQHPEITDHFTEIYYFADEEMVTDLCYREKYATSPLENIIIFRSGAGSSRYIPGADFGDNARALFEYMLAKEYDRQYLFVWLVKEPQRYEDKYRNKNVKFLSYEGATSIEEQKRAQYYRYLCLAKYIFFTESAVFCRNAREDQVRVQLWHGCGFKTLKRALVGRDEYKYEYMTVVSRLYAKLHVDEFGLREEQLLVTGYPKDDLLYHPVNGWREKFDIPVAEKYVFWLPTWRTTALPDEVQGSITNRATGLPILETADELDRLNDIMRELNVVLVIKLHPWQERRTLAQWELSNIVLIENEDMAKEDVQISELLGHASALISDYSSVAVDFTLLDRPIAFTLDDQELYEEDRGFLWTDIREWLPGVELFEFDDMVKFVKEVAEGMDSYCEKRRRLNGLFHDYDDDRNSWRVMKALGIGKEEE